MLRPSALVALLAVWPSIALGAAFEIDSRTESQMYQLRAYRQTDAANPLLLPRRRLVQYLGVNAYELAANTPLGFESSLRLYADFGLPQGEATRVDGLRSEDVDLLFANIYYHGKDLDWRLGRQIYTDLTSMFSFDGAWARYTRQVGPMKIGAEAYAGLWVKAGGIPNSTVYQPDGIRESDVWLQRNGYPAYGALNDIEPVVGAKALMTGLGGVSAGVGFKQAWLSGATDLRRLTADVKWTGLLGITVLGGIEADLLLLRIGNARWQARWDRAVMSVSLDYQRVAPLLSADSVFYYFANAPRDGFRLRADWFPSGMFRFYVQGLVDFYGTPLQASVADPLGVVPQLGTSVGTLFFPTDGSMPGAELPAGVSGGASLGSTLRTGSFRAALDTTFKTGWNGTQVWFDLNGGYVPPMSRASIEGRLSIANVSDPLNPLYKGTYAGFQVWGSWLLTRAARLSLVFESNFGPATRADTKLFVLYDLKAVL